MENELSTSRCSAKTTRKGARRSSRAGGGGGGGLELSSSGEDYFHGLSLISEALGRTERMNYKLNWRAIGKGTEGNDV